MGPYDYIVVGAGSAGCVLAHRLSADPSRTVLLLEAGHGDRSPFIHMPAGISRLVHNRRINWDYYTEPQRKLVNRRLWWPRGKVLGGSSSINAMCYIRGQAEDYDGWAQAGCAGWSYAELLPYFRASENSYRPPSVFHGKDGPLDVSELPFRNPLSTVFIQAAIEYGLLTNPDFNAGSQRGVGFYDVTQRAGRRCSSATAFLGASRGRPNLTVLTGSWVTRICLAGDRSVGVELVQGRKLNRVAGGEVVLAAGAVNSPQLLMLSGIGPPAHLESMGVQVAVPLPGVGHNLQDHLDYATLYTCLQPLTYDFGATREALAALRYWLTHSGPAVSNIAEAGGFVSAGQGDRSRPDVQLHFVPLQLDDHGRNRMSGNGFTLHASLLRPESRGYIELRSSDPHDKPAICPNYLESEVDLDTLTAAVTLSRDIIRQPAFQAFRGREIFPGCGIDDAVSVRESIRRKAETIYHPVGTCKMGTGSDAVVDSSLRVHGIRGLRVADASIMPRIVSGNTNAPTIMIAERAATLIVGA